MKWNRTMIAFSVVGSLVAIDAFAQLGSIRGKLVDEEGNPVADAECTIEVAGEGGRRSKTKSKKGGDFTKGGVRPGMYSILCEKEGFRKLPLQTQVSAFDQANLGQHVFYRLAPGELSESQHARATELLEEFNMASESGNDEETLAKLMELQEMMPESTEVTFNIAATYEAMGDKENAIEKYTETAEANPNLAYDSWLAVGEMHFKDREWAEAAGALRKAIDIKAVDPVVMFSYSVYSANAGDALSAKTGYEKTLELDPNHALAHYQLGLAAVSETESDVAIHHFEQFLSLAPDHDQAEAARGVIKALKEGSQ